MPELRGPIKTKGKLSTTWTSENPVLLDKQMGFETNSRKVKFGDGVTAWNSLPYAYYSIDEIDTMLSGKANLSGAVFAGNISMDGHRVVNLAAPVGADDAVRKIDLDSAMASIGRQRGEIDCSANPNYPASIAGDRWEATVAGKIGGASGVSVSLYDEIVCKTNSGGGNHASEGSKFYVIQGNIERATESTSGYLMLENVTEAQNASTTSNEKAMTALRVWQAITQARANAGTWSAIQRFVGGVRLDGTLLSKFLKTDAGGNIIGVDNLSYADLGDIATVASNLLQLPNPSAVRYLRVNADNTVTAIDADTLGADLDGGMVDWSASCNPTGFSGAPTEKLFRYNRTEGSKMCHFTMRIFGNASGTGMTVELPFAAANTHIQRIAMNVISNNTNSVGYMSTVAGSTTATITLGTGSALASTSVKGATGNGVFETV